MIKLFNNNRSWWIWIILLAGILLAFLIWWHFDRQIEKLRTGALIDSLISVTSLTIHTCIK